MAGGTLLAGYQGIGTYAPAPTWWFTVPSWGTTSGPERTIHTVCKKSLSAPMHQEWLL